MKILIRLPTWFRPGNGQIEADKPICKGYRAVNLILTLDHPRWDDLHHNIYLEEKDITTIDNILYIT